jgi:hypothetical protein
VPRATIEPGERPSGVKTVTVGALLNGAVG